VSAAVRLEAAYAELRAAEVRLKPEHPDVIRAKRLVADLEQAVQDEAALAASQAETPAKLPTASETVKRNRLNALQFEIESLERQIADKTKGQQQLLADLQTYQGRIEAVPTRESELASLMRDYDTLQGLYRSLLTKREDSKVAENLERRQVGEQFKIIDAPRMPETPFWPDRQQIDLIGAVAGLALGIGLAALLDFRDKSLNAEADVAAALGLPVLAMIPSIVTSMERRRARSKAAVSSVGLLLFFVACGTIVYLTLAT
jgi:uncharacterized protein involved in exopolysaccharide biosynthesis